MPNTLNKYLHNAKAADRDTSDYHMDIEAHNRYDTADEAVQSEVAGMHSWPVVAVAKSQEL
jgi:hypothetical protein